MAEKSFRQFWRETFLLSSHARWGFKSYQEIPHTIADEVCGVAKVNDIRCLSLADINDYLNGLDSFIDNRN
tara:strand:- start:460 stop:672 length:213 start_codon:yes stop_codon:yes gene_type:complete